MERRIKFIYGLTICAIVAYSIMQGYWLYSRYQLSLEEYESELYGTIIACAEEDIAILKSATIIQYTIKGRFMSR